MKLGAYMIVKNEESCIEVCLKSLKDLDEVIILDTGSTDKTEAICTKFKNVIFIKDKYKWKDDFADARNFSRKYTTADWLIVIDADEILKGDVKKLKNSLKHTVSESFKVQTVPLKTKGKHLSVRLHKNIKSIKWDKPIHNVLSVLGDKVLDEKYLSIHYGYSEAHQKDPDRAFRILDKYVKEHTDCKREKYYLAREYYYKKEYRIAITYWKWYLETADFGKEMADASLYIARCYFFLGNVAEAKKHCMQAICLNSNFREAWRFIALLSGPGNKKRFNQIADTASNEGVLFVRGE